MFSDHVPPGNPPRTPWRVVGTAKQAPPGGCSLGTGRYIMCAVPPPSRFGPSHRAGWLPVH
jgi:hypothetical protein